MADNTFEFEPGCGWRVVCECGYIVEGLQRADAEDFARKHADDEHEPHVEKPHDDLEINPKFSGGSAFDVIDHWMACRGDIFPIGHLGNRYCLTDQDVEHLSEHVGRWVEHLLREFAEVIAADMDDCGYYPAATRIRYRMAHGEGGRLGPAAPTARKATDD